MKTKDQQKKQRKNESKGMKSKGTWPDIWTAPSKVIHDKGPTIRTDEGRLVKEYKWPSSPLEKTKY